MKKQKTLLAEKMARKWYSIEPQAFDTSSNSSWFEIYCRRWLGNRFYGLLYDMRIKQMPYETFRRVIQKLIHDGEIKLSEVNMKSRRRKSVEVNEVYSHKKRIIGWNCTEKGSEPIYG